jgi:hypothetical protein
VRSSSQGSAFRSQERWHAHTALPLPLLWLFLCALWPLLSAPSAKAESIATTELVQKLMTASDRLANIRFAEVVEAATGQKVLPIDPQSESDQRILAAIETATRQVLADVLDPSHSVHTIGRINEVSNRLEDYLMAAIDAVPGIFCGPPLTRQGTIQAAGYPDMIIVDEATGRVVYLDPKVHRSGSETSGFRTFYYEPKNETNKINANGSHLILGLAHVGKVDDKWTFDSWNLVDLFDFEVRLKAEFQASNRDLYRADAIIQAEEAPNDEPTSVK